jgi:hypothetical protein
VLKSLGRVVRLKAAAPRATDVAFPLAGDIYSFRTSAFSEFARPETGRYAAFKILGVSERHLVVAVLDGVWNAPPSLKEASRAAILREHRFAHTGRLAVFGLNKDWWSPSDLHDIARLGDAPVSRTENSLVAPIATYAPGASYSTLMFANYAAEGEWRWAHDRDALVAESERAAAKSAAERAAREERYRTRLSKLTWDRLLAEMPFERWTPSPPFPSQEFTLAARDTIRAACIALSALGPKPRKADVRAVLRECVEWFNDADEGAGGAIETEEREDIRDVLEEMAYVARQKALIEEIDQWRTW